MKYIEELYASDCFVSENLMFILTTDFKKNGQRLGYSLATGSPKWFDAQAIVDISPIYTLDKENNIIPIKETPKDVS